MAGPITWRNINAPDFSNSATLMQTGSQALQGGLDKLTQLGKDYQARQEQAWEKGSERNRDAVISQIMGLKDMDAYNAFGEQLPGILDQYSGQIDRKAVMDAWMKQDNSIRDDAIGTEQYRNMLEAQTAKPIMDRFYEMIGKGQDKGAEAFINSSGDLSSKFRREAIEYLDSYRDENRNEAWQQTQRDHYLTDRAKQQNEVRLQEQAASIVSDVMANPEIDLTSGRELIKERAREAGLSFKYLNPHLQEFENTWAYTNGLTSQQLTDVKEKQAQIDDQAKVARQQLESSKQGLQDKISNVPNFAKINQQALSRGELNQQVLKDYNINPDTFTLNTTVDSDQNNLSGNLDNLEKTTANQMKLLGIEGPVDYRVILEAIAQVGTHDNDEDGGEIDFSKVAEKIPEVLQKQQKWVNDQTDWLSEAGTIDESILALDPWSRQEKLLVQQAALGRKKLSNAIK
jgi:hypothetical protein